METLTLNRYKGIDDLQNTFAWTSNSQGDEFRTNSIEEAKKQGAWVSYQFPDIDPTDQDAINAESARRKQLNDDYVQSLIEKGEYKQKYDLKIHFKPIPTFDRVKSLQEQYTNAGIFPV